MRVQRTRIIIAMKPDDTNGDQETAPALPESLGGFGGDAPTGSGRDWRLLNRAVREQWNVPEGVFKALPGVATKYAVGNDANGERIIDPRTNKPISLYQQFTAMRILMDMKRQNTDTARLELDASRHAERDVNINVGVQVGELPIVEVVVSDRDEARQFADFKRQVIESNANRNGNGEPKS